MWSASSNSSRQQQQQINYGIPNEMGMMGFRDMFVLAPAAAAAATFHHHHYGGGVNQHQQQHYQDQHQPTLSFDTGIPLLSASPYIQTTNGMDEGGVINGTAHYREIHFQQPVLETTYNNNNNTSSIKKSSTSSGAANKATTTSICITCRDCGNQAKKGCSFKRCRTCCKSRGFDCSTHVKSTWVPAARRRERQLLGSSGGGGGNGGDVVVGSAGSSQSINSSSSKKPKVVQATATSHASTSNTTPPTSFESGSSHQADHRDVDVKSFGAAGDGGSYNNNSSSKGEPLPGQVRAPAVFKCVRVTAMDDGDDEYAYQATVKIGGHVFKGFLYDQGVADQVVSRDGFPSMSDLHLGGGGRGGGGGDESSSPAVQNMLHSSDVYGMSGGHMLGGSSTSFIC